MPNSFIAALTLTLLLAACSPASVAEAEARHDVSWLSAHESRESYEALGRLADHDSRAASILSQRTGKRDVYHAAWQGHLRGAAWGDNVLRTGLSATSEIPLAVAELPPGNPHLDPFALDLERSVGLARGDDAVAAAALLASIGSDAHAQLLRLVDNPATRDAACQGLRAETTSEDSRLVLTTTKPEARVSPSCKRTVLAHAAIDSKVLAWVGASGETELIASASTGLECPQVSQLWESVFSSTRDGLTELQPALTASTTRCPETLDPLLSRTLPSTPRVRAMILRSLDVETTHAEQLGATCRQLPRLQHGAAVSQDVRSLAGSVYGTRCKPTT